MTVISREELKKAEDAISKCISTLKYISGRTSTENSIRFDITCEALCNHLEFVRSISHFPASPPPPSPPPPPLSPTASHTQYTPSTSPVFTSVSSHVMNDETDLSHMTSDESSSASTVISDPPPPPPSPHQYDI